MPGTNANARLDANHAQDAWLADAAARFERPLLLYAQRLTGDADRARDVVQEAFLKLGGQSPAELNGRLPAWLFAVCRNGAIDQRRKEKRVQAALKLGQVGSRLGRADAAGGEPGPRLRIVETPAQEAETRDSAAAAMRIIEKLPAKQREAVTLKFQAGLSYREIAEVMGESETNVGFLIHRGLKTVRERMQRHEGT